MSRPSRCLVQQTRTAPRLCVSESYVFSKLLMLSVQQGELEHRNIKRRYMHTNKQRYIDQMVNRDVLERVHERMNDEIVTAATFNTDFADSEESPSADM